MASQTLDNLLSTGIYDIDIIKSIKSKNFSALKKLSTNELSSATYMYPLLWAVKNDLGTFEVYSYMSEELQSDTDITSEVLKVQPELFVGSPLSKDRRFILANIAKMPQLSLYMSETLKSDAGFVMELCSASSPETAKQILEYTGHEENTASMDISPDVEDIVDNIAIANAISAPSELTSEQKNNHDLIKSAATQSNEFFDFVANHAEEFGFDGLQGAIDAGKEKIVNTFEEVHSEKPSIIKNEAALAEIPHDAPEKIPVVATQAWLNDTITPQLAKQILNYAKMLKAKAKTERGQQMLAEVPEEHKTFIAPQILEKCTQIIEEHNRNSSPSERIPLDTDFLQQYSNFTSESIETPPAPWEAEEAYYNEQIAKRDAEAAALCISPEEYAKTHPILDYEEYLAMQEHEKTAQVSLEDAKEATLDIKSKEIDHMTNYINTNLKDKTTNKEIEESK